jgi:hypothetical protein
MTKKSKTRFFRGKPSKRSNPLGDLPLLRWFLSEEMLLKELSPKAHALDP